MATWAARRARAARPEQVSAASALRGRVAPAEQARAARPRRVPQARRRAARAAETSGPEPAALVGARPPREARRRAHPERELAERPDRARPAVTRAMELGPAEPRWAPAAMAAAATRVGHPPRAWGSRCSSVGSRSSRPADGAGRARPPSAGTSSGVVRFAHRRLSATPSYAAMLGSGDLLGMAGSPKPLKLVIPKASQTLSRMRSCRSVDLT